MLHVKAFTPLVQIFTADAKRVMFRTRISESRRRKTLSEWADVPTLRGWDPWPRLRVTVRVVSQSNNNSGRPPVNSCHAGGGADYETNEVTLHK